MLKKASRLITLVIFAFLLLPIQAGSNFLPQKIIIQNIKEETFTIDVVFVGYDEDLVLEENIDFILHTTSDPLQYTDNEFPHTRYLLEYTFSFYKVNTIKVYLLCFYIPCLNYKLI